MSFLDRLGIGISALCLVQCLAVPLALIFAPLASVGLFSHEAFHLVLLAVIVPVGALAYTLGFLRHRNARMWIPAAIGFALLVVAAVLEQGHWLHPVAIAFVTSAGGAALIVAHVMNMRSGRA
ncbi:MAG: MerC domain-containing protein [Wenzhouxiangellaceae bacterium]|nr:MerC domain-containing protein [Wenzhouxiangellaceae bacterium]